MFTSVSAFSSVLLSYCCCGFQTPRRFLRSNEISLPLSGMVDIPLKLTFTHQVCVMCVGCVCVYDGVGVCVWLFELMMKWAHDGL